MSNNKEKNSINDELKSKELTKIMVGLICFLILTCLFGYIGYKFCLDNNYNIQKGIVFGALFPIGLAILKELDFGRIFPYIVYIIVYIIALDFVPTFVGVILLLIIVFTFLINFISVIKKDGTQEINKMLKPNNSNYYRTSKYNETENKFIQLEEEYECERCFKKISEEDYDLYDGMCEECFDETHYDINGNQREDYWNY